MKTFIDQVIDNDRSVESILDFIDERLGLTFDLAEDIGLTEEEYSIWSGDLTNERDYVSSLNSLIESKKLNRSANKVIKTIKEAQKTISKILNKI